MTTPVAVLTGPPGAGKTTVGPLLAASLGTEFLDTDTIVEQMTGKLVSDVFVSEGEDAFRRYERSAVERGLSSHRGVLALGGGAVMDPGTQRLLAGHRVVYLRTDFAIAVRRVGLDVPRPLLLGNPRAKLKELLAKRLPVYEALAWITVDTDDRDPQDIADEIAATIAARIAAQAGEGAGALPGQDADPDAAGGVPGGEADEPGTPAGRP